MPTAGPNIRIFPSAATPLPSPSLRPAAAPLRAADPSVPAWQRFDRYSVNFVQRQTDGSTVLSLQAAEPSYQDRVITLRDSW